MRRLAAVLLTSTVVLAGAGLAPAHAVEPGESPGASARLPLRAIVDDPVGDVETEPAHLARLIDLRRVAYRTPARTGGTLTVRATWQDLRNGNRRGVLRQRLLTFVEGPGGRTWVIEVSNRRGSFRLFELRDGEPLAVRVRPETVAVRQEPGARGRSTVRLSTEWLPARRVALTTLSTLGGEGLAYDDTRPRALRVGPVAGPNG